MKVPCGGFDLDESVFNVDKNAKQVKLNSPISYDYMPDGYPKKDGWSIVWDENTEGKLYIPIEEDFGVCKISDMVPTDDDLLGATVEFLDSPGNTILITENDINVKPNGYTSVVVNNGRYFARFNICKKDNIKEAGITYPEKGVYIDTDMPKIKITKENITPMSTDFLPKNLNVVFRGELGHAPTNCNVTYNELRGWVERDIPVSAVFISAHSQFNIIGTASLTDSLGFVYSPNGSTSKSFVYKSDGTFGTQPNG